MCNQPNCRCTTDRCVPVVFCCGGKKVTGKAKIPVSMNVTLSANLTVPQTLPAAVPTVILFNNVIIAIPSGFMSPIYNPMTGTFMVPRCGEGIYQISANVLSDAATGVTLTVNVGGTNVATFTIPPVTTIPLSGGITFLWRLSYPGESVSIIATSTGGGSILAGSNLSIRRVGSLNDC